MAKIAVLVTDMVEDVELTDPVRSYEEAGHSVTLLNSNDDNKITGKNGETFKIDKNVNDVKPEDFDALLVPGGFSPDMLRADPKHAEFATHFMKEEKPVFAICHGPQFLVDTDLLKGHEMTSFVSVRKDLENAGANVVDKEVVVSRNLVTSRIPDDIPAFNKASLDMLDKL
ncbi:type 1 glutamine amidotransferase domain-containing protein [Shouchella sp. JSM 1781072]|uniref:type 1 glutamine amidotransferase domain-containing protein n=1 Tax=Bacillaceae TaxID=186817 RepID=UPI000C071024|nr:MULTISPECIES: type 1 glutamine amidotransferase domain-containing protein [Bacillaceae]UTR07225.1 type 1 glutamine amidotransferase [Alkalihalobacillus sp. LMS6]